MLKHKQLIKHDVDNSQYGDCFRTAIACLLNMNPLDVPHVFENGDFTGGREVMDAWLYAKGFNLVSFCFDYSPEEVLALMENSNPKTEYLLVGKSPRGFDHNVVCIGGKVVHDPWEFDGGIVDRCTTGFTWVEILSPVSPNP